MTAVNVFVRLKTVEERIKASNRGRMRRLTTAEMMILLEGQSAVLDTFTATWPEKSGLSKSGWGVRVKTRGQLGYRVYNDVEYSSWVHHAGGGYLRQSATHPDYPVFRGLWTTLLIKVRDEVLPDISDRMIAAIDLAEATQPRPEERMPRTSAATQRDLVAERRDQRQALRPFIRAIRRIMPIAGARALSQRRNARGGTQ